MKVKKFTANTMQEAMQMVKEELGSDAVILQTRTLTGGFLGLFPRKKVEITAASDVVTQDSKPAPASRPKPTQTDFVVGDESLESMAPSTPIEAYSSIGKPVSKPVSMPGPETQETMPTSRIASLEEKIALLTSTVEKLVEKSLGDDVLSGPWGEVHRHLQKCGIEDALVQHLVEHLTREGKSPEECLGDDYVFLNVLEKEIRAEGGIQLHEEGQKVVVLIGPTGVGKTTTLAKIAAEMLAAGRQIGFITADTYRLAAVEQLQKYADIMGLPLETVYSPKEMEEAIARQSDKDVVFVDTAGRSQHNSGQMEELQSFVEACQPAEVHLLLAATTKREDLEEIVQRFSLCPIDRLILTKADESTCFGPFFSVINRNPIPFSYITTGQNVPEDIEDASCERVAQLIYRGSLEAVPPEEETDSGTDQTHAVVTEVES